MEKHLDRSDILEDNMTKLFSLLWLQFNEALQQSLLGHEYFEYKDISFDSKWLLYLIKVTTQWIKGARRSNPSDSVYKLIRQYLNFCQAADESCDKFLIPKYFRHQSDDSQSPDRYEM